MTHSDIWAAIDKLASEHNMTCSGLARCSGLDSTTFNKSKRWTKEGKPRWPSTQSLAKILASTGSNIEEFAKFLPRNNSDMEH